MLAYRLIRDLIMALGLMFYAILSFGLLVLEWALTPRDNGQDFPDES